MTNGSKTMKNLYQKINDVRRDVAYIRKEKQVDSYLVVTHDQVTAELREPLIKHGIIIVPSLVSSRVVQDTGMTTKNGAPIIRYEAIYDINFVDADEPDQREVMRVEAHACDTSDKAPGKALSYATKNAMLKMFSTETGENDEGRIESRSPKPSSAKSVSQDVFDSLGEDEQKYLAEIAETARAIMKEACAEDAVAYIRLQALDVDEKVAINALFTAPERRVMKAAAAPKEPKNDAEAMVYDKKESTR